MAESLSRYIPEAKIEEDLEIHEDLAQVVERISKYLPPGKVWEYFSSSPSATGGRIRFPNFRGDMTLNYQVRGEIYSAEKVAPDSADFATYYKTASEAALQSILWIEVGFQGLDKLAKSSASSNWFGIEDDEEWYKSIIRDFIKYREKYQIKEDCFSEFGAEELLEDF